MLSANASAVFWSLLGNTVGVFMGMAGEGGGLGSTFGKGAQIARQAYAGGRQATASSDA